ncbi:MAG: sodium:solute symporter family protein [Lentisphaerae bacterium]|jgi:SSS family solute:Na+ symporter|nr:sodium:solute symporter family protein [Lentisphaerota bacterium]
MPTGFGISLTTSATTIIGVVAFVYFVAIMLFGTYFSRFSKNLNDYFYSGQRFAWWLAAASMVATGIGSYSYLKYTEQGFNTGLSSTMTYLNDWFIVPFFMFGWLPIIYFARVRSIPEYFERRFGRTARYLAVVIIMMYMFFYIGYNLFTMGVAIEGLFGIPQIWSIPVITFFIGVYVTFGGQTAVIFTDLVQGIMLYLAGGVAIFAGLWALGGFGEFWGWLPITHRLPFVDLLADAKFNASGLFWGEALAGSIAFTFMNQGFIMRYLTIRSVNEGRKASLFNVAITLPLSAIVCGAVGWLAKSIVTKQAAMGGALAGIEPIHIQNTFHTFIVVCWETLKHNSWLFGFVVAALTAALMSTVDTLINACAAIGIFDIYKPLIKPDADDKHYLKAARWASAFATILGLLLVIWFNRQEGTLMSIHYKGIMLIIPPIVTTIFLGAFWRRFNAIAASIAMLVGIGFTMATNWFPKLTHPLAWFVVGNKHDIYMPALFGMLVTAVVGVIITLLTKPDTQKDITGLTVDTLDEAMVIYKGGTPNHAIGKTVKRIAYRLDESIPFGLVSASMAAMERMKANEGDMCYLTDARGWLGGLRSQHVKFAAPHALPDNVVLMSKETKEDAFLLDDRPVTLDKIF